jgi:hypothetical protein
VNGGTTATGGITLVNGNNISVAATASKAGCIALDARNGPFTLQAGILSADGAAGQSAGCIVIAADTVTIGSNGTIRANDDGTKGYNHYVAVATRQLGVTGTVNMQADGKGVDTGFPGAVLLLAEGSLSITIPEDYLTPIPPPVRTSVATTLTVNGSGSLVLRANGAINRVDVVAKPITFSNTGTLTITANGASQNAVRINNPGATSGVSGLSFTGGNVTVRSDGVSGVGDASGGYVEIFGDQMTLNANTHTFSANGPAAGNGNGGRFYLSSTAATLKNTGKVTVTANAASAGSGNAILGDITTGDPKAIQFFPGSVNVDAGTANGAGQYSFAAKGGSTGGNGGTIYMGATSMTIKTANAIVASAIASGANNGDGGEIYLNNYITVDAAATVSAIGKGTGKGGKFRAFYFNPATALNVNTVIKVNGGNSLPVANFHGQIKLNSVTCRQWKNANATFPKSGWHCINPDAPSPGQRSIESSAFTLTPASLKTDLLNQNTHIYSMDTINEFQEFFYGTSSTTPGIFGISIKSIRVSVAFDRQVGGSAGGFSFYYPGTILHELGHTWDGIKGNPSTNAALTFMSKVDADVNSFNAMTCANAITATTGNATYCTTYAGQTNFWIYQKLLGFVTPGTTDYQEAWARSFGHRGQSSIPNPNKNFPTFVQNIEELMTQQKAYMNTIFTTGVPF